MTTRRNTAQKLAPAGAAAMVDILHKVGIKSSSQNDVYRALTTLEGLSAWWTDNTQGESKVGAVLKF